MTLHVTCRGCARKRTVNIFAIDIYTTDICRDCQIEGDKKLLQNPSIQRLIKETIERKRKEREELKALAQRHHDWQVRTIKNKVERKKKLDELEVTYLYEHPEIIAQ